MQKLFVIVMMFTVFWGISASRAEAFSIGPYVEISTGSGSLEWDISGEKFDIDMDTAAIGFTLDTAAIAPVFLNYRLNVGFEGKELEDEFNTSLDLTGITVDNIFGFTITQSPYFRWWFGPFFHFGFHSGDADIVYDEAGIPYEVDYEFAQLGGGCVTGFDFMINPFLTFSSSIGFRAVYLYGTGESSSYYTLARYEEDLEGSTESVFLNLALLF